MIYNDTASKYDAPLNSTTVLESATVAVYTIQARFQENDKDLLGLADDDDIDDEDHTNRLSVSARIGIGVGAAIVGIIIITAVVFLFLYRDQIRERTKTRPQPNRSHHDNVEDGRRRRSQQDMASAEDFRSHHGVYHHESEPLPPYTSTSTKPSLTRTDAPSSDANHSGS